MQVAQVGLFNRSVTDPNFKLPPAAWRIGRTRRRLNGLVGMNWEPFAHRVPQRLRSYVFQRKHPHFPASPGEASLNAWNHLTVFGVPGVATCAFCVQVNSEVRKELFGGPTCPTVSLRSRIL